MKILGVAHSTRLPLAIHSLACVPREVQRELPRTEELKFVSDHLTQGSKVGLECPVNLEKFPKAELADNTTLRFWKGVDLLAKRKGVQALPLEAQSVALHLAWRLYTDLDEGREPDPLLRGLLSKAREQPGFNLDNFMSALLVYRSLLVFEKAKEENCDTLIVGGAHARHLELLLDEAEHHKFYHSNYSKLEIEENERKYRDEVSALKQYRPLLDIFFGNLLKTEKSLSAKTH